MELKFDSLQIDLGERSYPIIIGEGLINVLGNFFRQDIGRSALIVTNETVGGIYLDRLRCCLGSIFDYVFDVVLSDG